MAYINITQITLNPNLPSPQIVSVYYKFASAADTVNNYTVVTTTLSVPSGGVLSPSFNIINLIDGVDYTVKVKPNCRNEYYLENFKAGNCCPAGYTMSNDGSTCFQVTDASPTSTPTGGNPASAIARTNGSYSTCGSYIYGAGYNIDGTGSSTKISDTNNFWKNGAADCVNIATLDGPLNRAGLWISDVQNNQDIGFSVCLNINSSKTYHVGIACDNYGIIKLNGNTIVQQDETALNTQYNDGGACFKVWHIYPVTLNAGPNVIELIGHNVVNVAALGAEIYDNTPSQISAATSYSQLNLVFSTKDYIGQPIQIGPNGAGYTCPSGYALASCTDPVICRQIITASKTC